MSFLRGISRRETAVKIFGIARRAALTTPRGGGILHPKDVQVVEA
jgi:hypothetical protein